MTCNDAATAALWIQQSIFKNQHFDCPFEIFVNDVLFFMIVYFHPFYATVLNVFFFCIASEDSCIVQCFALFTVTTDGCQQPS